MYQIWFKSMFFHLFEDNVDVTSYKLRNLLSFSCLHRIVRIRIIAKILQKYNISGHGY